MQPKLTPRSPAFRTTFTKEVPRADTTLLALALTGFLAATGCGEDDGAVLPSAPDAGGSLGDATEASDAATDASNASTSETQVVVADAGDDTSESAPITLGDAGPDGGPNGGNGDVDQDGVTVA